MSILDILGFIIIIIVLVTDIGLTIYKNFFDKNTDNWYKNKR